MADAALELLLENLQQLLIYHAHLISDTKNQVERLEKDLRLLKDFLNDFSKKCRKDNSLRELITQIHDVVYEVEDVIDAFVTQATKARSRNYFLRALKSPVTLRTIAKEVEAVGFKVRDIYGDKSRLDFATRTISDGGEGPQVIDEVQRKKMSSTTWDLNLLQDDTEDVNCHAIGKKLFQSCIAAYVPQIVSSTSTIKKRAHGGSTEGRRYIRRERKERHELIMNDYFRGEKSKYTPDHFRRRFRMDIGLFMQILHAIKNYDDYFTQKFDAVGNIGLSPLQKMIAAVRMLAYGCAADQLDEYVQIGESTTIESLQHFCDAVIGVFEKQYLRKPNHEDIKVLLKEGEARGFPGMLGSLDCMHWHWKYCPTAWHGTHTNGFEGVPTLILEIVASKSLWIWHAFFGMAGTNNDITVTDRSPLFDDIINSVAPPCSFMVHGHRYNMGYYLSDGIYPQYATLIQSIYQPSSFKETLFAKQQEAIRKDVERAFGVLQSRWHIVRGPARMWNAKFLGKIMKTCIILHNMIIEREFLQGMNPENWQQPTEETASPINVEHDFSFLVTRMIDRTARVHDKGVHKELKSDLINHLWDMFGDS